jgi:hypothetical protein
VIIKDTYTCSLECPLSGFSIFFKYTRCFTIYRWYLLLKFEQFSWIQHSLKSGGTKDHVRWVKVPNWKACLYIQVWLYMLIYSNTVVIYELISKTSVNHRIDSPPKQHNNPEHPSWENLECTCGPSSPAIELLLSPFLLKWGNRNGRLKWGTEFIFSRFDGSVHGPIPIGISIVSVPLQDLNLTFTIIEYATCNVRHPGRMLGNNDICVGMLIS